ncbi:hypothetical protein [uncultured Chryseobacterium sp.]|uniref:hypothetical protein n=1 Tax=uncultured Chryseobacterium sp. TaxID=259322 RepID=UPI0025D76F72|nr:hypothetical protein [uncultured Chryseobacterium sp.]
MKLFQIIAVVFCLGIFLIPKDSLYLENRQETCCRQDSSMEGMDCCKKDNPIKHSSHQNKEKKSSSCDDSCCSSCVLCYTFIETPFSGNPGLELSYYQSNKNLQFQYSDPYLSDRLKEIWQPPKIG